MRLIDADALIDEIKHKLWDWESIDGITATTVLKQTITDIENQPTVLLKEQEAVEPKAEKAILDYQSWHYICGDCGGQIDIHDNYCRHCGRVVAHLSNKI